MNKNYITENISIETMAKLTDEMLNFEKNAKRRNIGATILKIVPAVAAIVLVIGLANFMGWVNIDGLLNFNELNDFNEVNSGAVVVEEPTTVSEAGLTNIPRVIEKSIFENFLEMIPEEKVKRAMKSYYGLVELDNGAFYVFDPYARDREIRDMLTYWNEYISWSDRDYAKMLLDYQMLDSQYLRAADPKDSYSNYNSHNANNNKTADIEAINSEFALRDPDLYAHVRFGENKNILLLDVEWHTPETYTEEVVEEYRNDMNEYKKSEKYIQMSDEDKAKADASNAEYLRTLERDARRIKSGSFCMTRMINGRKRDYNFGMGSGDGSLIDISGNLDSDGYYIYNVYPQYIHVGYSDENGEQQIIYFGSDENGCVYSKQEFDSVIENEALPVLDELLEKGLITEHQYNYIIKDPLDYYVEAFFGTADAQ